MSDDEEDYERVNARVPKHTKEAVKSKLDHGGISRVIRERLEQIAHGAEVSERKRVKDNLNQLRDDRRKLKRERDDIDSQIDDLDVKIERAENELDSLRDKEGEYEGALSMIESKMHEEGMHVFNGHNQIEEAARIGECSQEDVIADLKERNPTLEEDQFTFGVAET